MPIKARSIWISGYRSVVDNLRGHSVVMDLPRDQNGEDTGATALEFAVMALAGCVTTIFKIVAEKRKLDLKAMKIELEAEKPEGAKTITKVKGNVEVTTDASQSEVETVFKLTLDICPVGIIFQNAGIKSTWSVVAKKP